MQELTILLIGIVLQALAGVVILRLVDLYVWRLKVINGIFSHDDYYRRLLMLKSVSEIKMLLLFWKKPESFFKDKTIFE